MFDINKYRKTWRLEWLEALLSLSDLELQTRWINKKIRNPAWTYIEFMNHYFDDLDLVDGYEKKIQEGYVSHEEYNAIEKFHIALEKYKEPNGIYDPEAILNDPEWIKITEMGQSSLKNLETLVSDAEEKDMFSKTLYAPDLTVGDYIWPKKPTWFQKIFFRLFHPQRKA